MSGVLVHLVPECGQEAWIRKLAMVLSVCDESVDFISREICFTIQQPITLLSLLPIGTIHFGISSFLGFWWSRIHFERSPYRVGETCHESIRVSRLFFLYCALCKCRLDHIVAWWTQVHEKWLLICRNDTRGFECVVCTSKRLDFKVYSTSQHLPFHFIMLGWYWHLEGCI